MTTRLALFTAVFTVVVGGLLAWYAFKPTDSVPASRLAITAYIDPAASSRGGCVRRLDLVVTVRNTAIKPAKIAAIRFLAGSRASFDARVGPRRLGGDRQIVLRFDVAPVYARLRAQRIGRSITHVEVRDGEGIRHRRPVGLNSDARICGN